jgi:hypothetical protein
MTDDHDDGSEQRVDHSTVFVLQKRISQPWGLEWHDHQVYPAGPGQATPALNAWVEMTVKEPGRWKLISRRTEIHERTVREHRAPDAVPKPTKGFEGARPDFAVLDEAVAAGAEHDAEVSALHSPAHTARRMNLAALFRGGDRP